MNFETVFELNQIEFNLKIFNDNIYVCLQIIRIENGDTWSAVVTLEALVESYNFLEGCFFKPDDLAEYLVYAVSTQEFRIENSEEDPKILNVIFWIQKEKEDEIEQYEFYFPLHPQEPEQDKKNELQSSVEAKGLKTEEDQLADLISIIFIIICYYIFANIFPYEIIIQYRPDEIKLYKLFKK